MPKISIIVPVYNVEKYVNRCIKSILAQTFTDFELILVDDGSKDSSGKICDMFAEKDNRIIVCHTENKGVSAARNLALSMACGQYVMFCDSDDYVDNHWCEILLEGILKFPDKFVVSDAWKVNFDKDSSFRIGGSEKIESFYELYKRNLSCSTWNKIYNLEILKQNCIFFEENCLWSEDVPFNTKYCEICNGIVYIDIPLYYYCDNENSATKKYYPDFLFLNLKCFSARLPLINQNELGDFCDEHLSIMIQLFNNVFDERNKSSFFQKLNYNQKIMSSDAFKFCVKNATGNLEGKKYIKLLKTHNYYLLYLYTKFRKIIEILKRN